MTTEQIAYCEMCEAISVPSAIGEDCDECEDGFYEEFLEQACDKGDDCEHELHHHGHGVHIGFPQDFGEEE